MIISINPVNLEPRCECGDQAVPGLFSVQVLTESPMSDTALSALEPMALCQPCGDMASASDERALGVVVFKIEVD